MKTYPLTHPLLALAALAALTVYILACGTAFSPDDSKVLYPTIDAQTGATGIAAYDRTSGKSELLFLPTFRDAQSLKTEPTILRPQWASGGKSVVVAWAGGGYGSKGDDILNLAVLPVGSAGPVKFFVQSEIKDAMSVLLQPLPILGNFLFIATEGESNQTSLVRLDLATGALRSQTNLPAPMLMPSPNGDGLIYLAAVAGDKKRMEVGFMNAATLVRSPAFQTGADAIDPDKTEGFLAVSRDGKRLAFGTQEDDKQVCRVLQNGKLFKTLPLPVGEEKLNFGNAQFSPNGDTVYVSFMDGGTGGTNVSLGVFEILLNGGALRRHTLIQGYESMDNEFTLYFQLDVSHDGKTLAIASTYLAYEKDSKLKPEDCALFLLNLADPQRQVTRVPIPLPPKEMLAK